MNHLLTLETLANRYMVMRHGHSLANRQGIIVSHPPNGCNGFGLSGLGRQQVRDSLQSDTLLDAGTIVISSDFVRAAESAVIVHETLGCHAALETDVRLRERNFGELELGPDSAYDLVWDRDRLDADSSWCSVESARRVMARVTDLIADLEGRHAEQSFLLVSHGDALQILQTAFARRDASQHRRLEHLHTAEIRLLQLA